MAWVAVGVAGASVVGGLAQSYFGNKGAQNASNAQQAASQAGIAEQRRQFDQTQANLAPYLTTGQQALGAQGNLLGLNGGVSQQEAIDQLKTSPYYTSQLSAANDNILANGSATGTLRGGNTEAALAKIAPSILAGAYQQQFQNYGSLTGQGLSAATGQAQIGQGTANAITGLQTNIGQAEAGGALARSQAINNGINSVFGGAGYAAGRGF